MHASKNRESGPWGLLGLCTGFLVTGSLLPSTSFSRFEPGVLRLEPPHGTPIDAMNLRQLRALPAIGHARALSILESRARAEPHAGSLLWMKAPGIGPRTQAKLELWLAGEGLAGSGFRGTAWPRNASDGSN